MRARSDRGQLVPLYAVVILVAGAAMLLLVHLGSLAVDRARARTAADAAALAGAADGRGAADAVAVANGGVLESFEQRDDDVAVVVRVGSAHATAWARRGAGCRTAAETHHLHFDACQSTNP